MKLAFVSGGLHTEASGVVRILCDLANALARAGDAVTVYTTACPGREPVADLLAPPVALHAEPGRWLGRLAASPALRARMAGEFGALDVIHNHSLWMLPNHYASRLARQRGKPVLFTAYGYLEPWALARSRWKKRLAAAWFQDRDLRGAACLHANTLEEAASLRAYGLSNPIAVVPNGVTPEDFDELPGRDGFDAATPAARGRRVLLFLSRLHPKKGLEPLVRAWSRIAPERPDWVLVLAGPDDGDETRIRRLADETCPAKACVFAGPRTGDAKRAAYAAAEAFVLPSFSEGFSQAVLEAMAAARPVLLTPGCHFPEVVSEGAGLVVEPTAGDVERGLRDLLARSDAERQAMGVRGRALVARRYAWNVVARSMQELYAWVAGGGVAPAFVERGSGAA